MDNTASDIKYIIVIGASAGGFGAVTDLVSRIPANLPTAVFIVLHMAKNSSVEIISQHLAKVTNYQCGIATNNEPVVAGKVYLARPDLHLQLKEGHIRLTKGAHENRYRPSIDVLFRSAAAYYGSKVIGFILSGMLDDGTSGMSAIKRSGGTCIVQEPLEATYTDMPVSVLNNVDVDYRVPVSEMGYIIDEIFARPAKTDISVPADVRLEAEITERMVNGIDEMQQIGIHSNFTCPDCGGGLWLMENDTIPRYRCHTGHVYSERLLMEKQNEQLEESLWISIRMLEERRNLLLIIADRNHGEEQYQLEESQRSRAAELDKHIYRLKALMIALSEEKTPKDEGYL